MLRFRNLHERNRSRLDLGRVGNYRERERIFNQLLLAKQIYQIGCANKLIGKGHVSAEKQTVCV